MKLSKLLKVLVVLVVLGVLLVVVADYASNDVAWRITILKAKLSGKIPEIPLPLFLRWMLPGSPVYLGSLAKVPNVNSGITNLHNDPASAAAGARVFGRICAECHGDNARGRTGPDLLVGLGGMTDWKFFSTVKWGRPKTIMVAQPLSDLEIWQVYAFVRQMAFNVALNRKSDSANASIPPVTVDRLLSSDRSNDWLTYAGNYSGFRHSLLTQISRRNVQHLRLAWAAQLPSDSPSLETTPIVADGRMYVTESPEGVTALDAKTGALLWQFHRPVPADSIPLCCGSQNRGVAILNKTIYVATLDAHLIALDAATGSKRWDVTIADWHNGYSMTGAPLAIDDRIVVGIAGGDFGIRGFLSAYSAVDGSLLWKFYTVPAPGEPGHETWGNADWEHGGVSTWATGSYDPALGLLYWGTSNPDPVFYPKAREGVNLYANSVIALEAKTGKLRWYYQFTPSDDHDWDATQQPVLADIQWHGQKLPVLLEANRNAFYYVMDRATGRFLLAAPFAKQSWNAGFTPEGQPIVRPEAQPSRSGTLIFPAAGGATNWWTPSFDPSRGLLFVPSVDASSIFFNDEVPHFHAGKQFSGSGFQRAPNQPITLAVRAIDASTGTIRWDSTLSTGGAEIRGELGGVLSTEGGLVFLGFGYEFFAFDADTGAKLWITSLGGMIHSPPVSYALEGRQYITITAGHTLFVFSLPPDDEAVAHASATKSGSTSP